MKYGIIVNGRVTEPVFIPRANESDPLAWLAKQFPTLTDAAWVEVPDCAVPGTKKNEDGTFTEPPAVEAPAAPQSSSALILERLTALTEKLEAVEAKVDALTVPEP
jgi:hypothetical protein